MEDSKIDRMKIMTPQKRVEGLGTAHGGVHHWWIQRTTAIALIPLIIWNICGYLSLAGEGHEATVAWFASPWTAIAMTAMIIAMFWHLKLGLQVVIEDYVHKACCKTGLILANRYGCLLMMIVSVIAILKLHLTGYPA